MIRRNQPEAQSLAERNGCVQIACGILLDEVVSFQPQLLEFQFFILTHSSPSRCRHGLCAETHATIESWRCTARPIQH